MGKWHWAIPFAYFVYSVVIIVIVAPQIVICVLSCKGGLRWGKERLLSSFFCQLVSLSQDRPAEKETDDNNNSSKVSSSIPVMNNK